MRWAGFLAASCTVLAALLASLDAPYGLSTRVSATGSYLTTGFLFVPEPLTVSVHVPGRDDVRVLVDGQETGSSLALSAGPHVFEVAAGAAVLPEFVWRAATAAVSRPVPAAAWSPQALSGPRWRARGWRPIVGALAASAWVLALLLACWAVLRRVLPGSGVTLSRPMLGVLAFTAVSGCLGITWGWPGGAWAPDELSPAQVLAALDQRFSGGWFDLYPPGHFYVLSLAYAPALVLKALGWLALEAEAVDALLFLLGRIVSLFMALGVVVMVGQLAEQIGGHALSWAAALCAAGSLPFAFYAKLANVDVPYLFWFAAALLFYRDAVVTSRARSVMGFALTGMLAIATKDQAYGLFVVPSLWLAWRLMRSGAGRRVLALGAAAAVMAFVLLFNLPLNLSGFTAHVASITGGGSETYRMVPATFGGFLELLPLVASQLWWAVGVPGVALCAVALWRRSRGARLPRWLWLFPLSYLFTFVVVVGYSYDRFLLPVTLVLGLLAGEGLRALLEEGWTHTGARLAAAMCVVWLAWRVISVDALMMRDSRYAAEAWLRESVPPGALVASTWQASYRPRLESWRHQEIQPTPAATLTASPDFIVVNTEFAGRYPPEAPMPAWLRWLESGEAPYQVALRVKDPLRWTELAWWPTFRDRRESLFTNLDKANPEIVIFRRRGPAP